MAFAQHSAQPLRGSIRYAARPALRRPVRLTPSGSYAEWSRVLGYVISTVVISIGALAVFTGLSMAIPKGADYGGSGEVDYSGVVLATGGVVLVLGLQVWNRFLRTTSAR